MKNFLRPIFGSPEKSAGTDAYVDVLGIPPSEQPPNLYRLLDIQMFESSEEVIRQAAEIRRELVKQYAGNLDQKILNQLIDELNSAEQILTDSNKRTEYEDELGILQESPAQIAGHDGLAKPESKAAVSASPSVGSHLLEELTKENESLQERVTEWRRMSVDYQKQVEIRESEISRLKKQLDLLTTNEQQLSETFQSQQESVKNDLELKTQELADKENQLNSLSQQNRNLQSERDELQSNLDELKSKLEKMENRNRDLIAKFKVAGPKVKKYKEEIRNLQTQLVQASEAKLAVEASSQKDTNAIQSLTGEINALKQQLTDREGDFEKERQKLVGENAELKRQLAQQQLQVAAKPEPSASATAAALSGSDQPLIYSDSLSEIEGQSLVIESPAEQHRQPVPTDPVKPVGRGQNFESRGTDSSLVALSNDPAEQVADESSLCTSDDETGAAHSLIFRVRDRLNGSVVLEQGFSAGDCIRIGRIPDFCTFDVLARQLSSDRVLSGRHFQLTCMANGVHVQDVGSTNGTLAAGELLKKKDKLIEFDGFSDNFLKIRAGELFQFELERVEADAPLQKPAAQGIQATMVSQPPVTKDKKKKRPRQPEPQAENEASKGKGFGNDGFLTDSESGQGSSEIGGSQDSLGWDE